MRKLVVVVAIRCYIECYSCLLANPSTEPMELMVDGRVAHEHQVTERLNFLRQIPPPSVNK